MVAIIGAVIVVFGGAAVVFQIANDRERDGSLWAFASLFVSMALAWVAWTRMAAAEEPSFWMAFMPILAVLATNVAIVVLLLRLPIGGSQVRGSAWRMSRLSDADGEEVELALAATSITMTGSKTPAVEIAFTDLREARGDGEALRLTWSAGDAESSVALMPIGEATTREARVRFSEQLAKRIARQARLDDRVTS